MKVSMLLLCCILSLAQLNGQQDKGLNPGDQLPNLFLTGFLSDSSKKIQLQEIQDGKLLLIDFWATWCVPCLENLHHLDSLKKLFPHQLEVIAVSYQSRKEIQHFFTNKPRYKNFDLNYISDDTLLWDLFPHKTLPHSVWINAAGKVSAITSHLDVTAENINKLIHQQPLTMERKKEMLEFDPRVKLTGFDSLLNYSSQFYRSPGSIGNGGGLYPSNLYNDKNFKHDRYFVYGKILLDLYIAGGYQRPNNLKNTNLYRIDLTDSLLLFPPQQAPLSAKNAGISDKREWWSKNKYAYELIVNRPVVAGTMYQYLWEDLKRAFSFKAEMKKIPVPCWVIVNRTKASKQLTSKGGAPQLIWPKVGYVERMQNCRFEDLLFWMNIMSTTYPILDETINKVPFDLPLGLIVEYDQIKPEELKTVLRKNGFDLKLVTRTIPVLHITDK